MKTLLVPFLFLAACSCSKPTPQLYTSAASGFEQAQAKAFGGSQSIENSLLLVQGEVVAMHDPYFDGSLFKAHLGTSGLEFRSNIKVASDARFTHVIEHQGVYYNFVLRSGDVYLLKSPDLVTWTLINGGRPVLTHTPGTIYANVWNVGAAVDDVGTWHLLVESADGLGAPGTQGGVGLAYSFASMVNDEIDFDLNRTPTHVIANGGNPDLKFVPGKGLLAVHGSLIGGIWRVRASTRIAGTWRTSETFEVGSENIQVCDPSLVELSDGSTLMSVSVDQNSIYLLKSKENLASIFERVAQ